MVQVEAAQAIRSWDLVPGIKLQKNTGFNISQNASLDFTFLVNAHIF